MADSGLTSDKKPITSILYVDDEEDHLFIGKHFLERTGEFHVDTMTSAQEALKSPNIALYDVIISDYQMPGMDGIELLKTVRSRLGDIPFILFTGRGREEIVIEAVNNGVDFYQQKGGEPESQFVELSHKIRQVVRRRQAEKEIRQNYDLIGIKEQALLESEEKYRTLVEYSLEAIIIVDLKGKILFLNQAAGRLIEMDRYRDIIGTKNVLEYVSSESRPDVIRDFGQVSIGVDGYLSRYKIVTTQGHERWVESVGKYITYEGEPSIQASLRDITERQISDILIQESEEKFRALVEHSLEGILIVDFTGVLLFANQATATIIDAPDINALIGKTNVMEFIAPGSKSDAIHDISRVSQGIDAYLVHYNLISMKKRDIWVECIGKKIQFRNAAVILVSMRDITERKQAEEALRQSERKFSTIFRSNPVPLTLVSVIDRVFVDVNDAFLKNTGFTREDVIGKTSEAIRIFFDREEQELIFSSLRNHKSVSNIEVHFRIKSGEVRVGLFSANFVMMSGKPHVLASIDDITERKDAENAVRDSEKRLRKANRQLILLTSITRHDILNKISIIKGLLEITEMENTDPEQSEYFRMMSAATTEIQAQIEFTRVYRDLGTQEPQWIELDTILPYTLVPASVIMTVEVPHLFIFADPMLEKVFSNLLDNSIRHGQRVTEIRISVRESGSDLIVVWEDNGMGISYDEKELIFERGYGKNTGIGMFLIREILSLTDISIHERGEEGIGARFEILIPKGVYRI